MFDLVGYALIYGLYNNIKKSTFIVKEASVAQSNAFKQQVGIQTCECAASIMYYANSCRGYFPGWGAQKWFWADVVCVAALGIVIMNIIVAELARC